MTFVTTALQARFHDHFSVQFESFKEVQLYFN
jgi:hypothetical protein